MAKIRLTHLLTLGTTLLLTTTCSLASPQREHWVGTWAASPVGTNNASGMGMSDATYREIVHVSLGGSRVRIVLSNEFGTTPLTVGAASIAQSAGDSKISAATVRPLTFGGQPSIIIPAGALAVSDACDFPLPALTNLAVSLFLPAQTIEHVSVHTFADQTGYIAEGNVITAAEMTTPREMRAWPFLKGVDVLAMEKAASIVAFGDSITDGAHSTLNANARWPDVLAQRLHSNHKTAQLGVLNEGIGGNRILHDVAGPAALARFDRDVLSQTGVKYVIVLEGINDIGHATSPVGAHDPVTADQMIQAYMQMIDRAHLHGLKIIGATLTPYAGAKYASSEGEQLRQSVNQWIRTSHAFDGVLDFDKVLEDAAHPDHLSAASGSTDNLHPGDSGYQMMGDSIDLSFFTK